jgi:hypothetical protein
MKRCFGVFIAAMTEPLPAIRNLFLLALCAVAAFPARAGAQSSGAVAQSSTEMDAILFVQSLPMKNGKEGIDLVWVPKPLERLCLGKTSQQCANMDYCIRTTSKNVSTCRNLAVPLSSLPKYPANMTPRRQLSVVLMYLSPDHFANLQQFFHSAPRASLQRLSLSARVKARVRLTRTPDDDSLDVLEIMAVAPF